ncbi:MAG TPA: FAD-binding oxidoreductase, partial [Nitrososphaera sp.]|nr:FAD-binding oxidoreductase [Nitrososphaera sp.]
MPIHDSLVRIARGEVLDDEWSRLTYSVDSSHYQVMPEAVVFPADAADVQEVCKSCHSEGLSVAARGAGTGLLGQSLSRGIMLDLTKHMNRIIDIDTDQVITQPGVVKRFLDLELKKRGKFLPPDPASSNYCTIGGMIANNSSGIHCLGYGHTIDFLDGVRLVYTDGSEGNADGGGWDDRMAKLRELLVPEESALTNGFPRVTKNSCGYRLDAVMSKGQFLPHKVLAASEGTLGIVTEARFRILDLPEHRALLVLGFEDLLDAMKAVTQLLQFRPAALEMMDHTVVAGGKPVSDKGCILFVEFAGDSGSTQRRLELCIHRIGGLCSILECASDEQSLTRIWGARKGALNNIM